MIISPAERSSSIPFFGGVSLKVETVIYISGTKPYLLLTNSDTRFKKKKKGKKNIVSCVDKFGHEVWLQVYSGAKIKREKKKRKEKKNPASIVELTNSDHKLPAGVHGREGKKRQ